MGTRDRFMAGLARQLGRPDGWRGRLVARRLNRRNRGTVAAAVDACGVGSGDRAADVGFGGGVGLDLLLDRVGPDGHVDGVDLSETMISTAMRRYREQCSAGRLTVALGSLLALPLPAASLDGLITVNTIYFVDDLALACTEIARVMRPTGRAVIGIADPQAMAAMPFTAHGFRIRPLDDVIATAQLAGLDLVRHDSVGTGDEAYHLLVAARRSNG
jgi:arsenite methyltransferase